MATSGIGPISRIGPGGAYAGRIVGLQPLLGAVARYGPAAVELARVKKDFNDAPAGSIVGTSRGRVVKDTPRGTRWSPTSSTAASDFGGMTEDEYAAHAQQVGRENRRFYNRTVGTPRRRPMAGGFGDDFSDLEKMTP
jgi:hypothetical protein